MTATDTLPAAPDGKAPPAKRAQSVANNTSNSGSAPPPLPPAARQDGSADPANTSPNTSATPAPSNGAPAALGNPDSATGRPGAGASLPTSGQQPDPAAASPEAFVAPPRPGTSGSPAPAPPDDQTSDSDNGQDQDQDQNTQDQDKGVPGNQNGQGPNPAELMAQQLMQELPELLAALGKKKKPDDSGGKQNGASPSGGAQPQSGGGAGSPQQSKSPFDPSNAARSPSNDNGGDPSGGQTNRGRSPGGDPFGGSDTNKASPKVTAPANADPEEAKEILQQFVALFGDGNGPDDLVVKQLQVPKTIPDSVNLGRTDAALHNVTGKLAALGTALSGKDADADREFKNYEQQYRDTKRRVNELFNSLSKAIEDKKGHSGNYTGMEDPQATLALQKEAKADLDSAVMAINSFVDSAQGDVNGWHLLFLQRGVGT